MLRWMLDLMPWHPVRAHYPHIETQMGQEGNSIVFRMLAGARVDGAMSVIWERSFTIDEIRAAWERWHVREIHMRADQATAMREDAINRAQWGTEYGLINP